jgi:hypothetical protein
LRAFAGPAHSALLQIFDALCNCLLGGLRGQGPPKTHYAKNPANNLVGFQPKLIQFYIGHFLS